MHSKFDISLLNVGDHSNVVQSTGSVKELTILWSICTMHNFVHIEDLVGAKILKTGCESWTGNTTATISTCMCV